MERNSLRSRCLLAVVAAALAIAGGHGCIDTSAIRANSSGAAGVTGAAGITGAAGVTGVAGITGAGGGTAGAGGADGKPCDENAECGAGFCVDHVCCTTVCEGPCVSCNLPGHVGTCWPLPAGTPAPSGKCPARPPCGETGTCDGRGGCSVASDTVLCNAPSCATTALLNTAGTCDGLGTCRSPGLQDCNPYRCAAGACTVSCATEASCAAGVACVNGNCGLRTRGNVCFDNSECLSNHCVDGVCCESACTGACRSCALASAPGICTPIAAGALDPRGVCPTQGPAACGTNGKCDGSGGCQRYAVGTICAAETCTNSLYTPPATCNAVSVCVQPDSLSCFPYVCNGARCYGACSSDKSCAVPSVCVTNSCGLKSVGASCAANQECVSGVCAQGICCSTSCSGACQSCALTVARGSCTSVAAGDLDPSGRCMDMGAASCGTNGRCDGSGRCQNYPQGTNSAPATCSSALLVAAAVCDGRGMLAPAVPISCAPFQCDGASDSARCKSGCSSNTDCVAPALCMNGSCGPKANGQTCLSGGACASGFCEQGVCCASECRGICRSCAVPGLPGICSTVPNGGPDPQGRCADMGGASCGTDGFCNGNGGCRLYATDTMCAAPSCPAGGAMFTPPSICNGQGACLPTSPISCAPYMCGGTFCRSTCNSDGECVAPEICDLITKRCGGRTRLGQPCISSSQCLIGHSCVDGVCCNATACPTCQACNVAGNAGQCASVPAGNPEPHGQCTPNPPCGNTGACNGAGACQQGGTEIPCGTTTCSSSTLMLASHCTGTAACAAQTVVPCPGGFACASSAACLTDCTENSHCAAGLSCQQHQCVRKPNGAACGGGAECASSFCTNGVCCSTAACGTCEACNLAGGLGTCAPLPPGACVSP